MNIDNGNEIRDYKAIISEKSELISDLRAELTSLEEAKELVKKVWSLQSECNEILKRCLSVLAFAENKSYELEKENKELKEKNARLERLKVNNRFLVEEVVKVKSQLNLYINSYNEQGFLKLQRKFQSLDFSDNSFINEIIEE